MKKNILFLCVYILIYLVLSPQIIYAQQLAFPTAEGFGRFATGGRGGVICKVTNLNDAGAGSFRACMEMSGARTIIFTVSGVITLTSGQSNGGGGTITSIPDNLTIAGQTSPGGILIKGGLFFYNTKNVIMRHMRIRPGAPTVGNFNNAVTFNSTTNTNIDDIIIDHSSMGWTRDDIFSAAGWGTNNNVTIQWSLISESLGPLASDASSGATPVYGNSSFKMSLLHNMWADVLKRTPHTGGGNYQLINNLIYNAYSGAENTYSLAVWAPILANIVNNYFDPGAAGSASGAISSLGCDYSGFTCSSAQITYRNTSNLYIHGNTHTLLRPDPTTGSETAMVITIPLGGQGLPTQTTTIIPNMPIIASQTDAITARTEILARAGATVPVRDSVDARAVNHAITTTGWLCGVSVPNTTCTTYPTYANVATPLDTDNDGIPDTWEDSHGLNKNSSADGVIIRGDGYTNLERFLNELAGDTNPPLSYYVATTGNDANTCLQAKVLTTPKQTINAGLACASPGDTVNIVGGTYNQRVIIPISGTVNNPITLTNYQNQTVIIDGTGLGNGMMVSGADISYFILQGLWIKNHTGAGIVFYGVSHHVEIRNNQISNQTFSASFGHAILVTTLKWPNVTAGSSDIIIDGNYIHDVATGVSGNYNEALTLAFDIDKFQITNNIVTNVTFIGIDIIGKTQAYMQAYIPANGGTPTFVSPTPWPRNGWIANNTVTNFGTLGTSNDSGIYCDGCKNILIEHNTARNGNGYGIVISSEEGPATYFGTTFIVDQVIVRNNLSYNNSWQYNVGGISGITNNLRVAHNVAYCTTANCRDFRLDKGTSVLLRNNIGRNTFINSGVANYVTWMDTTGQTPSLDYNLYYVGGAGTQFFQYQNVVYNTFTSYKTTTGQDSHSLLTDPLFVNPATGDFSLQSGSPAINAGTPLTTAVGSGTNSTTLLVGDARWFSNGFGTTTGDTIQIGSILNTVVGINYSTNTITLATPTTWTTGTAVSYPWSGTAPDIGAFEGRTYYVAKTGNNNNAGTSTSPWLTIQKAASTAQAGDTVIIRAGTYYEKNIVPNSGTSTQQIIFQGERGPQGQRLTIIDGSDALTGSWALDTAVCGVTCYRYNATLPYKAYWLGVDEGSGLKEIIRAKDASWLNVPDPYIFALQYTGYNVNYWDGFGAVWLGTGAMDDINNPDWSGGANPGSVWVRFRNGVSPATKTFMRVSNGQPVVNLTNKSYITFKDMKLQGARFGVLLEGNTLGNIIDSDEIVHGSSLIRVKQADNWKLTNSFLHWDHYGTGSYTAGAFNKWSEGYAPFQGVNQTPGSESYQAGVREKLWEWPNKGTFENSVMIQMEACANCTNWEISGNEFYEWPGEFIGFNDVSSGNIFNNYFHNSCSSPILPIGNYNNIKVYDNLLRDNNINLRLQSMELAATLPKQLYYYRNKHILDNGRGSHMYFHWGRSITNQLMPTGSHDLWFYHNSFTGGLDGIQPSPDGSLGDLLDARFINNIMDTAYVWADVGTGVELEHFAYNRVGASGPTTSPWTGANHPNNQIVSLANGVGFWIANELPAMLLQSNSPARNAGINIAQSFTINGQNFAALPGFSPGYFSGAQPDLGAVQFTTTMNEPIISNGTPMGLLPSGTTELVISITTNVNATCKYSGTPGVAYTSMLGTFASTGGTTHTTPSGGLYDGLTQTWYIKCKDTSNNINTTEYVISYTIALSPPIISNGMPTGTLPYGTTSATFSVQTNVAATCKYHSISTTPYASMVIMQNTGGSTHSSPSGELTNGSTYTWYILCQDATGALTPTPYPVTYTISSDPPSTLTQTHVQCYSVSGVTVLKNGDIDAPCTFIKPAGIFRGRFQATAQNIMLTNTVFAPYCKDNGGPEYAVANNFNGHFIAFGEDITIVQLNPTQIALPLDGAIADTTSCGKYLKKELTNIPACNITTNATPIALEHEVVFTIHSSMTQNDSSLCYLRTSGTMFNNYNISGLLLHPTNALGVW